MEECIWKNLEGNYEEEDLQKKSMTSDSLIIQKEQNDLVNTDNNGRIPAILLNNIMYNGSWSFNNFLYFLVE